MKRFLKLIVKNVKLLLTVDPYNYRLTILRLLTFFGAIFAFGQYLLLVVIHEFVEESGYKANSFFVRIDIFALIVIVLGGVILFKQVKKRAIDLAAHLIVILLILIGARIEQNIGEWEVTMIVFTLAIITAGVAIKPTASILYGIITLLFIYGLDPNGFSRISLVSILLTLISTTVLSYLISSVITDSFKRNKEQTERLREQVAENRNVEGLLIRRNRELRTLNSIGNAVNSTLDTDEILSVMLKEIVEQREVHSSSVWLVDEDSGKNVCRQIFGDKKAVDFLLGMELDPGRGIVGKTIATGEVVLSGDVTQDPNHLGKLARKIGVEIHSILSVPIMFREKCLGTIQLLHEEKNYFNEEDIKVTSAIANMVATALEKARLHSEIKTQLSRVKQFGEALKQSDYKFRILAESTTTGIVLIQDGKPVYVNPAIVNMLGYTYEELYSRNFLEFLEPSMIPEITQMFTKVVEEGAGPLRYEALVYAKNGEKVWGDSSVDVIDMDGKPTFIGTFSDITKYKNTQAELEQATKIAQDSLRSKQEFLANIGHEIRTPLNALVGMSELLNEDVADAERKEYLSIIKSSTNNLLAIINDLLDFSKMEAGKLILHEDIFSIKEAVEDVYKMMALEAADKDLKLEVSIEESLPQHVSGDPFRLKQILINLVENAIKFTDNGKISVEAKLVTNKKNSIEVLFTVADTGKGIPENMREKIFETFEQVREGSERIAKGMGLGLSIVKNLAQAHDGKVWVESKVDIGSKFYVTLWYKKADKSATENRDALSEQLQDREINVLLVDDNEVNQIVAKNILSKANIKVTLTSQGREVTKILNDPSKHIDLVLLDLELPDISGFKVASQIRKSKDRLVATIPIIALTAHALDEIKNEVFESGMDDYVTKPFNSRLLIDAINKQLRPRIKGKSVDLSFLVSATDNDKQLMSDMIEQFFLQMDEVLEQIKDSISEEDEKKLAALVHQIKPSVTYMGIKQLKYAIVEFEKTESYEEKAKLAHQMEKLYSESIPELKSFLNGLK